MDKYAIIDWINVRLLNKVIFPSQEMYDDFEEIARYHSFMVNSGCFDDDPKDVEDNRRWGRKISKLIPKHDFNTVFENRLQKLPKHEYDLKIIVRGA